MKLLPIILFAAAAITLVMALMRVSSIKRYNRTHRKRRPRRVDPLTILMFPLAAVLVVAALLIPRGETPPAPEHQDTQQTQESQNTPTETDPPAVGGWTEKDGQTYYLNEDETPVTGWMDLDGKTYHFDDSGVMTLGWAQVDGLDYYFREDGSMGRGEVIIDGKNYYFDSRGQRVLVSNPWNEVPDDLVLDMVEIGSDYALADCPIARVAYDDLIAMIDACNANTPRAYVVSAYRDFDHQTRNYNRKVNYYLNKGLSEEDAKREAATVVAVPGTSEHEMGLAVDICDTRLWDLTEEQENLPAQQWLMEHSWEYGFIFHYPKGKIDVTGIIYEPWHYRWVGRELAEEIHNSGLTLEEYLDSLS